jgi:mannosylglucosylglycerate synthase
LRVAILHYASPPAVGGVEVTMAHHARGLAALGCQVRLISGSTTQAESSAPQIEYAAHPLFGSTHPDILRIKKELDTGLVSAAFEALTATVEHELARALDGCDVCIAHNVPTLHKNLPLTVALSRLNERGTFRLIAWCHDLAWTNEQYLPEMHDGDPYDLLRTVWARTQYVTVSDARQGELAALLNVPTEQIKVVTPGVDPAQFMRWTAITQRIVEATGLMDADMILLLPARLTRRKNVALGLRVLAALRRYGDARLVVTGPPGPHNPANPGYLGELLNLRDTLNLNDSAHFLYTFGDPLIPDDDTLADFFRLSDGLLFPSEQEGFGIPVLEAGLSGLPVFCSDIAPFRGTGQGDALYFQLDDDPAQIAARIHEALEQSAISRLRRRVRQTYRWDAIIRERVMPLLEVT